MLNTNQLDGAVSIFEEIVEIYPSCGFVENSLFKLGELYFKLSEFNKSREKFKKLIRKFPYSDFKGTAYYWVGESNKAQNLFEEAADDMLKAIDNKKTNSFIDYTYY